MASSSSSFLDIDPITVPGQAFALISVVPNEDKSLFAVKIRGAFSSKDEAAHHAKRLSAAEGNRFDIYLVDMFRWLALPPPDVNDIGDVVYAEQKLNDIMSDYEQNRAGAQALYEQRKLEVIRDGLDNHLATEEKIAPPSSDDALFNASDPLTVRQQEQTEETADASQA